MEEYAKIEKLYNFIIDNIDEFYEDCSGATSFRIPNYDLYARDYLGFAENQLKSESPESLINCVSNLKRAVDCQIDIFLYTLSLDKLYSKRNLKFDKKIELIEAIGLFNAKSLSKLNWIRNKMEHEYKIPDISEIDLYYDLVSAFISNIESAITVLEWDDKIYYIEKDELKHVRFSLKFFRKENPKIVAIIDEHTNDKVILEATHKEYKAFVFFLRCLYLLNIKQCFASTKYVKKQVEVGYHKLINNMVF